MFKKTFTKFNNKLTNYIEKKQTDELKRAVFDVFIENDIPYSYTKKMVDKIELYMDKVKHTNKTTTQTLCDVVTKYILSDFKKSIKTLALKHNKTNVIGVFGLNGVGKTSVVAKLANFFKTKCYKSVICVSFDDQRPTGKEQLHSLCSQIGVKYFPVKNVVDGLQTITDIVVNHTADVLLVDTAGFNPKNTTNIYKLAGVVKNIVFDERMLVVDGTSGQHTIGVMRLLCKHIKPTGVVISKTETDKKGGVFFSVKTAIKMPIYFITMGEKIDDICVFDKKCVERFFLKTYIFGDIFLQQHYVVDGFQKQHQQKQLSYDCLKQHLSGLIKKDVFSKIKSFYSKSIVVCDVKMTTETYMLIKKWIAIIQSMTKNERLGLCGLNVLRINRIAKGAGVTPSDVIVLKKKLEEINKEN